MNRNGTKKLDAKEARLADVALFARADRRAVQRLASIVDEVSVEPGRVLMAEGERHNQLYVLEAGTASVEIGGRDVAELFPGTMIGELGFFLGGPATATVRASSEVELMVIPHNRFEQVLADTPDLLRTIANELAHRLRLTDAKLT